MNNDVNQPPLMDVTFKRLPHDQITYVICIREEVFNDFY